MKNPFSRSNRKTNSRPTVQPVASVDQSLQQIGKLTRDNSTALMGDSQARVNSLFSEPLGVGVGVDDPLENIGVAEKNFHGAQARHIYRALDIVQRIIDSPAKDALRNGFELTTNFPELKLEELFNARFEELNWKEKARDFLIYSRLYSRGAIMFPVLQENAMKPSRAHLLDQLQLANVERVETLNIVHEDFFYYHIQSYDPLARNFGGIDFLNIHGFEVHPSRFHLAVDGLDFYRQRGTSVLDKIIVACKGLNIAEWTISNLLLRYRSLLVKYPAKEIHNSTPEKKKQLKGLLDDIKNKFTAKSVASVPDNYEFEYLETTFTGIKEATDFLYSYLSSVTKVPQSILKGSAQGELASAEKDERDYHENVRSEEQEMKLRPLLEFLIPLLLFERDSELHGVLMKNGIHPSRVKVDFEFNPLQSVNPMTDAQIKFIDAQRAGLEIDKGIRNADETRTELYPDLENFAPGQIPDGMNIDDPFGLNEELMNGVLPSFMPGGNRNRKQP